MPKDIATLEDIQLMVNSFYDRVRADDMLGPIFNGVIQDRWPEHLQKMHRFWQTVLLDEHTYYGSPFLPHAKLPVDQEHFNRWLALFNATIDEHFQGAKATRAKWQGERMAEMFLSKLQFYRNNPAIPLL
ncbi:MAG: group III truncated hemoglobin [Chitinophagaceae bacterium]|nr:group III truncated hemoglobin [Chitinophagaceae bacterium]